VGQKIGQYLVANEWTIGETTRACALLTILD